MGRFHQSMSSWNQPTETGESNLERSQDESASTLESSWQSTDGENDRDEPAFAIESGAWSRLASNRTFFVPLHYESAYKYPLVVWLHSNGYNENQIERVMPHISLRNYVGVGIRGTKAADSIGHRFDWHCSPAGIAATHDSVMDAVEEACERFTIHPTRIVLAGYGDGGTMALRIAMRQPDRFAGAISLGGRMPQGAIRNLDQLRRRRLPMLWQWGMGNPRYGEENLRSDFRSVMAVCGQVEVRLYPGEDEMDTVVLRHLDDWIMRRIVSNSTVADSDRWVTSPTLYSAN